MDHERALISKALREHDLGPMLTAGIRPDYLANPEHREAAEWMLEYHAKYSEAPTARIFKSQFPNYRLVRVDEPYDVYIDWVLEDHKYSGAVEMLIEGKEALEKGDAQTAIESVQRRLSRIARETARLIEDDLNETWRQRLDLWLKMRSTDSLVGLPTGFPTLDRLMGGMVAEQLVTLTGVPKSGKSTILMLIAIAANLHGASVLMFNFEMSHREMQARHDGFLAGVNPTRLMHGRLKQAGLEKVEKALKLHKRLPPFIISSDRTATTTVSAIHARVEQYKPDFVVVDGAWLLENEVGAPQGSEESNRAVSRALKRMTQATKKPTLVTVQALLSKYHKAVGLTTATIGYTGAWGQDSDVLLGVERPDDDDQTRARVKILDARNVPKVDFDVLLDWDSGQLQEMAGGEAEDENQG